jgi:hypothetical protein
MKNHIKIFILAGLSGLFLVCGADGQEKVPFHSRFLPGLTGGVTVSSGRYEYTNGPEPPQFNPMVFAGGGVTFDWRMARWFSLQNAFIYRAKGDRIDMKTWSDEFLVKLSSVWDPAFSMAGTGMIRTDIRYLEWSLCPNIIIANFVEVGIGGFVAVGLSGKETQDYTIDYFWEGNRLETNTVKSEQPVEFVALYQTDEITDALPINRFDYGLLGRLGFRLGSFTLAASLSYGYNPWEPVQSDLFGYVEPLNKTRNLSGLLSLTWLIGGKE